MIDWSTLIEVAGGIVAVIGAQRQYLNKQFGPVREHTVREDIDQVLGRVVALESRQVVDETKLAEHSSTLLDHGIRITALER